MNKKKLSILIYSLASGGAERVVSILLNELKGRHDITLYLMNSTIFYDIPKEITIVYLEESNPRENGIKKLFKLPLLAWRYKKLNTSDISLSFMYRPNYINILAKLLGMKSKLIISERAMPSIQHNSTLQGMINKLLIAILYKYADIITANSLGNSRNLIENFNCKDVQVINNPLDISSIDRLSREKVVFRDETFTYITVGRLDRGKNHTVMIDAMKGIDAKLYIIGDGELKTTLKQQITEKNLQEKVILLGKQVNPYAYITQADCFVFSSNYEGFPNVLLEALACGLPVISTDCQSGPREITAPKTSITEQIKDDIEIAEYGILTPVNDSKLLEKAMNLLINDDKLRENYKQKAKGRAKFYSKEKICKEWIKAIES